MKSIGLLVILFLVGCHATPLPDNAPAPKLIVVEPPKIQLKVVIPPTDSVAAVDVLSVKQLIVAVNKSLQDADDYVAWDMSRPGNINTLKVMTKRLSRAVRLMRAGKNQTEDVTETRDALKSLRVFLRLKGD